MQKNPSILRVLDDHKTSHWLKQSLKLALAREPLAAANDAALLNQLLNSRCDEQTCRAITSIAILQARAIKSGPSTAVFVNKVVPTKNRRLVVL